MSAARQKQRLADELVAQLTAALEAAEVAHRAATEGATHEEAKPENDKDTRAIEASYLARGQARRIEELRGELAEVQSWKVRSFGADDAVGLGALVTVQEDGAGGEGGQVETVGTYLIAPQGGGATLAGGVHVVTPRSPLGQALLGKRVGDDCEVRLTGRTRLLEIVAIG